MRDRIIIRVYCKDNPDELQVKCFSSRNSYPYAVHRLMGIALGLRRFEVDFSEVQSDVMRERWNCAYIFARAILALKCGGVFAIYGPRLNQPESVNYEFHKLHLPGMKIVEACIVLNCHQLHFEHFDLGTVVIRTKGCIIEPERPPPVSTIESLFD